MKLESLNLEKFKEKSLNNGQMHSLKGGGLVTGGGGPIEVQSGGKWWSVCYTYDSIRGNGLRLITDGTIFNLSHKIIENTLFD